MKAKTIIAIRELLENKVKSYDDFIMMERTHSSGQLSKIERLKREAEKWEEVFRDFDNNEF